VTPCSWPHENDTAEFKREVVEETISKLKAAAIEIYTDASVFRRFDKEEQVHSLLTTTTRKSI